MDDVLRAREQGQMAEDDDAVETVVYECQQATKPPRKFFYASPLGESGSPSTFEGMDAGWHRDLRFISAIGYNQVGLARAGAQAVNANSGHST